MPPLAASLLRRLDPRRSLRARVAWLIGCSGLAFAALTSVAVEHSLRGELEARVGLALQREARLAGLSLATLLNQQLRQVQQLAGLPRLASATMLPGDVRALLESARENQPELSWLALVGRDGTVQVATQTLLEGEDLSDEPWFQPGLRRSWMGDRQAPGRLKGPFGLTQGSEEPRFVALAAPLVDTTGQTFGVLVAQLDWAWVAQRFAEVVVTSDGVEHPDGARSIDTLLVGRSGQVDLGPPELLGQPLQMPDLAAHADERPRLLAWPDGGHYLSVAVRVPVPNNERVLHIVARQTEASAFGATARLRLQLFLAGMGLTGVFVLVSLGLARRVTAPVRALADTARRLRQGE